MSVIDDYLSQLGPQERTELERIRTITKSVTPDATETISYGMPVLKYKGKYLIGFCKFKNHLSIFPGAETITANAKLLQDFKIAKGTVQFTPATPIPEETITALLETRVAEIDQTR